MDTNDVNVDTHLIDFIHGFIMSGIASSTSCLVFDCERDSPWALLPESENIDKQNDLRYRDENFTVGARSG